MPQIAYGNSSLFCAIMYSNYVTDVTTKVVVLFALCGAPIFLGFLITFFGYVLAIRNIRGLAKDYVDQMDISVYKLLWYPALLFITFMPGFIDNVFVISTGGKTPFAFQAVHLIVTHSIGFTNALVYGFQRRLYYSSHRVKDENKSLYKNDILSGSITQDLVSAGIDDFA